MKNTIVSFLLIIVCINFVDAQTPTKYMDLLICTSVDHGQLDPAACVSFSMLKLGPDTDPGNQSGYDFKATKIRGFFHNRIAVTASKCRLYIADAVNNAVIAEFKIFKSKG